MDHPNSPAVKLWAYGGLLFVFVNSMGLHEDDCVFCQHTEYYLHQAEQRLKCLRGDLSLDDCKAELGQSSADDPVLDKTSEPILPGTYSRPILLQHFPLYRPDETVCESGHPDSMPNTHRNDPYAPKNDCLAEFTSKRLLQAIQPRLILDGHSHYGCHRKHELPGSNGKLFAEEWTVPAFTCSASLTLTCLALSIGKYPCHFMQTELSFLKAAFTYFAPQYLYDTVLPAAIEGIRCELWQKKLLHISRNDYAVNKCLLPSEVTIALTYILGLVGIAFFLVRVRVYRLFLRLRARMSHKVE
ncbi:unnamed protein product [Dibothriocephalus latus]|uniref:Uncharacterized protein n=1 Tax=Dibothriocephalus latus TaxID=60516 RepID=A0A3P7M334_DIBLA|nr:unnamed protein product [Dibothriocephalus latus]